MINRRELLRAAPVALIALILPACKDSPEPIAADDYFPLAAGYSWHYQTRTLRGGELIKGSYSVTNLGNVQRDLENYIARINSHGTEYLFRQDDSGVYRVGVRTLVSDKLKPDQRKRYVLKYPLSENDFWFADSHAFVIERTQPIREKFWNSHPFEMEYQLTARDETVQTPAGTFENCIRVEATGIVHLLADVTRGRYGSAEGDIHTTEWYAPGVGLVKLLRTESFDNALFVDGSFELVLSKMEPN